MTDWWVDVPAPRPMPAARRAAERSMIATLDATTAPSLRTRLAGWTGSGGPGRSRRPLVLGVGALVAVAATGAGVVLFTQDDVTDLSVVRCHTTLEAGDGADIAGTSTLLAYEFVGDDPSIRDAVAACARLWRAGVLRLGEPEAQPPVMSDEQPVPELTLCVTAEGMAAVFPGDQLDCASLGLPGPGA